MGPMSCCYLIRKHHLSSWRKFRRRGRRRSVLILCFLILVVCAVFVHHSFTLHQTQKPRSLVLITSYFRGGSSAVRRLFEQHNDVLVWEDPVAPLGAGWRQMQNDERMRNQHDRDRTLIDEVSRREDGLVEPLMSAIVSCDFTAIHQIEPQLLNWALGDQLYEAMSIVERMVFVALGPLGLRNGMLRTQCLRFALSVVRTTHFPMHHLPNMVKAHSDLKVIYIPRDPRGIVSSWIKLNIMDESLGRQVIKKFCNGISQDLISFNRAAAAHPQALLSLRIEDIVDDPISTVSTIYDFLDICKNSQAKPHAESADLTWDLKNTQIHLKRGLDPNVLEFSEIGVDWKKVLSDATVHVMSVECKHALVKLRYDVFSQ